MTPAVMALGLGTLFTGFVLLGKWIDARFEARVTRWANETHEPLPGEEL